MEKRASLKKEEGALSEPTEKKPSIAEPESIPKEPPKLFPPAEMRGPPTLRKLMSRQKSEKTVPPGKIIIAIGSLR